MLHKKTATLFTFIVANLLTCVSFLHAATLSFSESHDDGSKEVKVVVSIDTKGDTLNAYQGQIHFDDKYLFLKNVDTSNSIVDSWVTYPEKNNSTLGDNDITFEGVSLGGFSGTLEPGTEKRGEGKLFTLIFSVLKEGDAEISINGVHVYKHDGSGTEVPVLDKTTELALPALYVQNNYVFSGYGVKVFENEGADDVYAELGSSTELYGGRPFVAFVNKNSKKSLRSFEVSESPSEDPHDVPYFSWTEAKSPYLLTQSALTSYIHVKANYADGSYSFTTIKTVEKDRDETTTSYILMICALLALTILYVIFFAREKE